MAGAILGILVGAAVSCSSPPSTDDAHSSGTAAQSASSRSRGSETATTPGDALNGVFIGGKRDTVTDFEQWLGRPINTVVDFPTPTSWSLLQNPKEMEHWRGKPYRLTVSLPMIPTGEKASMADGAAGSYDRHFAEYGRRLVELGHSDAIIRVGWEYNLATSYSYASDPATFIPYFRRIVSQLRSVPGQRFVLMWNPHGGEHEQDATRFYPGDDVVDVIGVDVYDSGYRADGYPYPKDCDDTCKHNRADVMWRSMLYGGPRGLHFWSNYARDHNKPMALPEWGLWSSTVHPGGDDNPLFIQRMHDFIEEPNNRVMMHAYFDYDNPTDKHSLRTGAFPKSADLYRQLFGKG